MFALVGIQCRYQNMDHGEALAGSVAGLWYGLRSSRNPKVVASCVVALGAASALKEELTAYYDHRYR
jgi:hypothetical protein